MKFLLEIGRTVDSSLSLRRGERRRNKVMKSWGGLVRELGRHVSLNKSNEFEVVGVGWTGGKSRCRENIENVVVTSPVFLI